MYHFPTFPQRKGKDLKKEMTVFPTPSKDFWLSEWLRFVGILNLKDKSQQILTLNIRKKYLVPFCYSNYIKNAEINDEK
jgi:hypothetical protein